MGALVVAAAIVLVVAAPMARAATVSVRYESEEGFDSVFVGFVASPGERNRVTVTTGVASGNIQAVTFRDHGAPLRAARGCQVVGSGTVTCRTQRFSGDNVVSVFAGNRNDRVDLRALRVAGFETDVVGENGADTLLGSRAMVNTIDGDGDSRGGVPSTDRGSDFLVGGDQNDRITGGRGNDRIDGAAGVDELRGDAGDDTLIGGPGADRLFGGSGADRLSGGSGNDQASCGSGRDRVRLLGKDRSRGCERVRRDS